MHEIPPALNKQVDEKGKRTKKKAPKLSQFRDTPLGERDKGRYHAQADLRRGGDRGTPRPYLLNLAKQDEIMKAKERKLKSRAQPQVQVIPTQSFLVNSSLKIQVTRRRRGIKQWQQGLVTSQVWRKG
jgi:hypothetical protein